MKTFNDFIRESFKTTMTEIEARKILGLSAKFTDAELKSAYKKSSMKAHPDKGGSTSEMSLVNVAHEKLKDSARTNAVNAKAQDTRTAFKEKMEKMREIVLGDLASKFDINKFTEHFSKAFSEPFVGKHKIESASLNYNAVWLSAEFSNETRTRMFEMSISIDLINVLNSIEKPSFGGGENDISYPMGIIAYGYSDKKKVKVTQSNYNVSRSQKVFYDPEKIFPVKKITKDQKKKLFRRADMIAGLKTIQGIVTNDNASFFIPVENDTFLYVMRITFMRQGMWQVNGFYDKKKYSYHPNLDLYKGTKTFEETEETLDLFLKWSKEKKIANIIKDLQSKK
jgi:hypothetical protein